MSQDLRQLCKVIVAVINDRDFEYAGPEARRLKEHHIASDFSGRLDECGPWAITFDEQTEFWRQITLQFPDVSFKLVDTDVHIMDRTADVVIRAAMVRGDLTLATACQLKWKFTKGRWIWYQHNGMRGVCDYELM